MSTGEEVRKELLQRFLADRFLALKHLFPHRHKDASPEAHEEFVRVWNSPAPFVDISAFRGFAKSTLAEENTAVDVGFQAFPYALIVGNSYARACERLMAIKHEFETNDALTTLFDIGPGSKWSENDIILSNNIRVTAIGAGQSLRGVKHLSERPAFILVDDLEDDDNAATPEARDKLMGWFFGSLLPTLQPGGKMRVVGTPLHKDSLVSRLQNDPEWISRRYPVLYVGDDGQEHPTWPERFDKTWINSTRGAFQRNGQGQKWMQEYMCVSEDKAKKPFKKSMIQVKEPPARWMPKYMMVDPARTTNTKSARTGYVVWSWLGGKLIVHEALGGLHQPSQQIETIFKLAEIHKPVQVGIELDGLEQFISEPLRNEQLRRGTMIEIVGMRAPRNKEAFITSLQPFYEAGNVWHAKSLPDLDEELEGFPSGRIDVPNALAYCTKLRPGQPVYEDFDHTHVDPGLTPDRRRPLYFAMSARANRVGGVLCQMIDGCIRVYGDVVAWGSPVDATERVVKDAIALAGGRIRIVAPAEQHEKYTGFGLRGAVARLGLTLERGGAARSSENILAEYLRSQRRGFPAFLVDEQASWMLNGMAGGYARATTPQGTLAPQPEDNTYRVVVEALESFAAWFGLQEQDVDLSGRYATTAGGQRFLSSRPDRRG